jgi:hypothetical protein
MPYGDRIGQRAFRRRATRIGEKRRLLYIYVYDKIPRFGPARDLCDIRSGGWRAATGDGAEATVLAVNSGDSTYRESRFESGSLAIANLPV